VDDDHRQAGRSPAWHSRLIVENTQPLCRHRGAGPVKEPLRAVAAPEILERAAPDCGKNAGDDKLPLHRERNALARPRRIGRCPGS
jgi:hypothetical protein